MAKERPPSTLERKNVVKEQKNTRYKVVPAYIYMYHVYFHVYYVFYVFYFTSPQASPYGL